MWESSLSPWQQRRVTQDMWVHGVLWSQYTQHVLNSRRSSALDLIHAASSDIGLGSVHLYMQAVDTTGLVNTT